MTPYDSFRPAPRPKGPPVGAMILAVLIPVVVWQTLRWLLLAGSWSVFGARLGGMPFLTGGYILGIGLLGSGVWVLFAVVVGFILAQRGRPEYGEAAAVGFVAGAVIALVMMALGWVLAPSQVGRHIPMPPRFRA